jgi:hypothetical protein
MNNKSLELVGVHTSPSRLGLSLLSGKMLADQIAAGGIVVILDKDSSVDKALAAIELSEKTT